MNRAKSFDAVGFMRDARDRLSKEMRDMTPQEQIAYIRAKSCAAASERTPEAEAFLVRDRPPKRGK